MQVGYFGFIHVKGVNGYPTGHVVPIVHHVLLYTAHRKGTTFNEHETGARFLFRIRNLLEAAVLFVVIVPSRGVGGLLLQATKARLPNDKNCSEFTNR